MWDTISQIGIFVFGTSSILLIAKKNKWGFILGMISQPFWYITAYMNDQWGIFFMNIAYTISWGIGIYEWWIKKDNKKNK
jgi:nicotinamide riboside transporter PnuC